MAMEEDEEDFVFFGTPIEREEDTSTRKRKAVADAGQLRSLPLWKQEVRDEEGRKRFHGAFTGGYSAGYYNTVGSKEGWTPQTFTSSRKNRAEVKKQSIYNFLDDDDIKDMGGQTLETSMQFDTFGFTAAEFARKQAEKEQQKRPSAIPGPAPDEIVIPASNSIGIKLLLKMGWRRGYSIKDTHADSLYGARREARKAFLAFSGNDNGAEHTQMKSVSDSEEYGKSKDDDLYSSKSMPEFVLRPKQDLYGLGFDPYKNAPEFRDKKRLHESKGKIHGTKSSVRGNLLASNSGKYAPGFGIGALEELDYEDEDIYASGFDIEQTEVEEDEPVGVTRDSNYRLKDKKSGSLPGFKVASGSDYTMERFHPPVIPANFDPHHKFSTPLETASTVAELPPPEVPSPENISLRKLIDGFATLVARCGKRFEDLSKEKNRSNPLFSFLTGGDGHNYYVRKLWEEKHKNSNQVHLLEDSKSKSSVQDMTAESRGRILGEKQLERSAKENSSSVAGKDVIHMQSNLSDTFTKPGLPVGLSEKVKPFKDDPAKQERFEQFLKDKYQGGLRSMQPSGTMSENDRAREKLEFEAAAEAIEKGEQKTIMASTSMGQLIDFSGGLEQQFTSSAGLAKHQIPQDEGKMPNKLYPKREEFQWRPLPILCKRFDIIDPFMGKPAPLPRPRGKMETFFFMAESTKDMESEGINAAKNEFVDISQSKPEDAEKQLDTKVPDIKQSTASVQKPVDLYKAIFSDDSDDDADDDSLTKVVDPVKNSEGANMTLNRLVAEDFLESLGRELGLKVPPDVPSKPSKGKSMVPGKDGTERNEEYNFTHETQKIPLVSDHMASSQRFAESTRNSTPTGISVAGHSSTGKSEGNRDDDQNEANNKLISGSSGGRSHVRNSKTDSRYDHRNSPATSSSSGDQQYGKGMIGSKRKQGRSKTPDSKSLSDEHQPKRNKSQSRHHRRRTSDTDSSNDEYQSKRNISRLKHRRRSRTPNDGYSSNSEDHSQSRSTTKRRHHHERSKRHSGHSRHKKRTDNRSDDSQVVREDREKDQKSSERWKHSAHSKSSHNKKYL